MLGMQGNPAAVSIPPSTRQGGGTAVWSAARLLGARVRYTGSDVPFYGATQSSAGIVDAVGTVAKKLSAC